MNEEHQYAKNLKTYEPGFLHFYWQNWISYLFCEEVSDSQGISYTCERLDYNIRASVVYTLQIQRYHQGSKEE